MKDNQKGFGAAKGLLILVIVGILGFLGWNVWGSKNNTSDTSNASCPTTIQTTNNFQLPSGWHWYEIRDRGLKYAYPASWGSPTTQTNSGGIQKYVASFTVSPSGANTMVSLIPDCSDFQSGLSDINNGKFDILSGSTITKAIKHNQASYSSLSHWSSNAGNHYKLVTYSLASVGNIKSVLVEYNVIAGSQLCPDDRLASNDRPECINQSIGDEVDKIISSLQKI